MPTTSVDASQQRGARVAGLTYLITAAIVVYANFGIHERLIVHGDFAETARNIAASERLFRVGIACDLVYCVGVVVLLAAFYVILGPVSRGLAWTAAVMRLVYALMWVLMTLNCLYALRLLTGADYSRAFEADRVQAMAKLFLDSRFDLYYVGLVFYGAGSAVFSYLLLKSRYIPRVLAAAGLASYAWCAACSLALIVSPGFSHIVNLWWFDTPMALAEIATSFWLLFKGLTPRTAEPAPAAAV